MRQNVTRNIPPKKGIEAGIITKKRTRNYSKKWIKNGIKMCSIMKGKKQTNKQTKRVEYEAHCKENIYRKALEKNKRKKNNE